MSSKKADPLCDHVMSALCRAVKMDTQALYTVRMGRPGDAVSDFLKSVQSHEIDFSKLNKKRLVPTEAVRTPLPLERMQVDHLWNFTGVAAVPQKQNNPNSPGFERPPSPTDTTNAATNAAANSTTLSPMDISPIEKAGLDDDALQKRLMCLEASLQDQRQALSNHTFGNGMQSMENISMCLPPVQALGLYYDPPDIKDMITEEARIPTNVSANGKSARQNRSASTMWCAIRHAPRATRQRSLPIQTTMALSIIAGWRRAAWARRFARLATNSRPSPSCML